MTQPSGTVILHFIDIEGSTALAPQHRDQWGALRARHDSIPQQALLAHDGNVFEVVGDAEYNPALAFERSVECLSPGLGRPTPAVAIHPWQSVDKRL